MHQSSSVKPSPQGDNPAAAPVPEAGFEEFAQKFWDKNRRGILLVCVAAVLVMAAREGWQYFADQREKTVQEDYARLGEGTERLAAFAEANPDHALAGVAYLRLADDSFEKADYRGAAASYLKAAGKLKNDALIGRARLGAAMSQLAGGDSAAGEASLKALSADQSAAKGARAEATYHLASLAAAAGRTDDLKKSVEDIGKIDASGTWTQRATLLLIGNPSAGPAAAPSAPVIKFTPGG